MNKKIMAIVMSYLGIKTFGKSETGAQSLNNDQRSKLTSQFGEEFTAKFESMLTSSAEENAAEDPNALMSLVVAAKTPELAAANKQIKDLQGVVSTLSEAPEITPAPQGVGISGGEPKFKLDMSASHNSVVSKALTANSVALAANATIDVSQLNTEFKTYLSGGANLDILKRIFTEVEASKYMTTKLAVTEYRATSDNINSVVQQFTSKWTPGGKAKFTPIAIKNRHHKINVSIVPADILESWLMYLYDESMSIDKMPISRYLIEQLILPKIIEDIELRMVAKGKFDEKAKDGVVEGGTAIAPEKGMDGFETILAAALKVKGTEADMGVNFLESNFDLKTCTDDQILAHVTAFVASIAPLYKRKNMPVFCGPEFYARYKTAYKSKWGVGSGTTDPKFGSDRIDYSNNILVQLDSMYASPILFSTPKENFIKLRHKNDTSNVINDVQRHNYELRIFGEFWYGVGFAIGEAVTAFVPKSYDPYATIAACYGSSTEFQQWQGANTANSELNGGGGEA